MSFETNMICDMVVTNDLFAKGLGAVAYSDVWPFDGYQRRR
jgi:hypothetical protein